MPYFLFPADPYPVIPSVVEESRGNGLVMFWIRFREMFRQAQHDRKQILRDEKQLLPLFSVGATIGRLPLCHSSGAKCPHTLSFRAESRNLVETNSFFFPAARFYFCLSFTPRGLSSAAIKSPLPRDERRRFACST